MTLDSLIFILENCHQLQSVRYIENWKAIPRKTLLEFWKYTRDSNFDVDLGENDWNEVFVARN